MSTSKTLSTTRLSPEQQLPRPPIPKITQPWMTPYPKWLERNDDVLAEMSTVFLEAVQGAYGSAQFDASSVLELFLRFAYRNSTGGRRPPHPRQGSALDVLFPNK